MTNRLIEETSPYLRQHAHNPVDWYPWGEAALAKSRTEKKPIFLSVGYSACHWCHVMERECFENEAIAALMNELFVCVKVDREERPDLDQIYMNVVQLMTGHGGWPMSVFLAPDQTPLFGGTYFPPDDRHGMPGFPRVLREISRLYKENPPELVEQTKHLITALKSLSQIQVESSEVNLQMLEEVAREIAGFHDPRYGGFGGAPKFPQTMALGLLLRMHRRTGDRIFIDAVSNTLTKMARGGIYDHLAGGFARYSVDAEWAVPHFEKMLYDNALLTVSYFEAYQATGTVFFREVGCGVLDYVLGEMTSPEGGFYSSQDADSEGEEGKFYVWDPQEIKAVLGTDDGNLMCKYFGVDETGNFEHGKTVLFLNADMPEVKDRITENKRKLLEARSKRIAPGRDEKILTSWNALMIRAMAKGYQVTLDTRYSAAGENAARFILSKMTDPAKKDRLLATYKDGKAKLPAYLDDYAYFTAALLDLFEITAEVDYLRTARRLSDLVLEHFQDRQGAGFYFIADDHETLIDRPKSLYDASIPSGNSIVIENLLRLAVLDGEERLSQLAHDQLKKMVAFASERPMGFANLLVVADRAVGPAQEIVLSGDDGSVRWKELQTELGKHFLPQAVRILKTREADAHAPQGLRDILAGKSLPSGDAAVYFCKNQTCSPPVFSLDDLRRYLKE